MWIAIEKSDKPTTNKPIAGSKMTAAIAPTIRLRMKTIATKPLKSLPSFSRGRWVIAVFPNPSVQMVERTVAMDTSQLKFPKAKGWRSVASNSQKTVPSKRATTCAVATLTNPRWTCAPETESLTSR